MLIRREDVRARGDGVTIGVKATDRSARSGASYGTNNSVFGIVSLLDDGREVSGRDGRSPSLSRSRLVEGDKVTAAAVHPLLRATHGLGAAVLSQSQNSPAQQFLCVHDL